MHRIVLVTLTLAATSASADKGGPVKQAIWFQDKSCASLEIRELKSISDRRVVRTVRLDDAGVVADLMARIEKIPADAAEMIKPGPKASEIDLVLSCPSGPHTIEIINNRFKTPSTGFNSVGQKDEVGLVTDIEALLHPGFGKALLKSKQLELSFKDFSITYLGSEARDAKAGAPTVSFSKERFLIKDKAGKPTTIEITAGQLPPPPVKVKVGRTTLTILTYETTDAVRLYPRYFQIVK